MGSYHTSLSVFSHSLGSQIPPTIGSTFEAGTATTLFKGPYFYGVLERMYDVPLDGRRFLMITESEADQPTLAARLIVVPRWVEELTRLAPMH